MFNSSSEQRFIGEPIEVAYDTPLVILKKPRCPDRFTWGDISFEIVELVSEWRDYGRRGRMASNMRPENARKAAKRGSWGVGRYYFHVRTDKEREFVFYYDRAPKGRAQREGSWHLDREFLAQNKRE